MSLSTMYHMHGAENGDGNASGGKLFRIYCASDGGTLWLFDNAIATTATLLLQLHSIERPYHAPINKFATQTFQKCCDVHNYVFRLFMFRNSNKFLTLSRSPFLSFSSTRIHRMSDGK